ncbi:MAG: phosphate ABC transporter permease subunit PstC [Spirochaetales bacterium]|nr:phosphate ABC transporter permease subunit PstC [Spirochaetales bacterium]MCF7937321.1 phosphate ABC transporter permease subunit PstC [Spirochaetales bacterium]
MATPKSLHKEFRADLKENSVRGVFFATALVSIITTVGIVVVLFADSVDFFSQVSIVEFFTSTRWSPVIKPIEFGVLPIISGTLTFTFLTALVAIPIGVLAAIYLSEYASERFRRIVKPALEVLAGIPTVVYGYFALIYVTPLLKKIFPEISTFNVLSASIMVGIMIIPTIASLSEDAMRAVPNSLRQAGYGLGITKFQVTSTVVVPASLSGIISSFILGISRAIGETMAVTIAAGNLSRIVNWLNPKEAFLQPVQTMTSAMVEVGTSDVTGTSVAYKSLFAVGLTLFVMTMLLNLVSQRIKNKYREKYE